MSILVTGGAGFIGSHLLEHLLSTTQERVVCLDNFHGQYDPAVKRGNVAHLFGQERMTFIRGDIGETVHLREVLAKHEVQRVVHLAGFSGSRESVVSPRACQEANVLGTLSVLEAAQRHGVERVVVASSASVYGRGAAAPFVEDAPLGVQASPYAASKRAAEILAGTWHQLYRLPTVCVRMFGVYGSRMRPDMAMSIFADRILRCMPITVHGDVSVKRDFTHISDICHGLAATLFAPDIAGQTFNLGSEEPISLREMIRSLERGFDCRAVLQRNPARADELPLTHADLTKSRELLGYTPRTSFTAGCADFCRWYLQTHAKTVASAAA